MNRLAQFDLSEINPMAALLALGGGVIGFVIAKRMGAGILTIGISVIGAVLLGYFIALNILER